MCYNIRNMSEFKRNYIVERATSFAADKHKNQYRNDKTTLYISHLVGVCLVLKKYGFSDEIIAAAMLHDVLEDTDTSPEDVEKAFGTEILKIVTAVTYDKKLIGLERKLKYIEDVKNGPEGAKAVSIADKIHNMNNLLYDLEQDAEKTWSLFKTTKEQKLWFEEEVLKMIKSVWDHPIISEYENLITELKTKYF